MEEQNLMSMAPGVVIAFMVTIMGVVIAMLTKLTAVKKDTQELIEMLQTPDKYGFGSGLTNEALIETNKRSAELTQAINQLSHFIEWMYKSTTGKDAPPYVGKPDG